MLAGPLPAGSRAPELGVVTGFDPAHAEVLRMLTRDGRPEEASRRSRIAASRLLRLASVAVLVIVAAIAVGAASRPHSVEFSLTTPQLGEVAVLVLLVLAGALGLILGTNLFPVWVMDPGKASAVGQRSRRMPAVVRAILTLVPLMVIAFLLAYNRRLTADAEPTPLPGTGPAIPPGSLGAQGTDPTLVFACVVVALAAGLVGAVLFTRTPPPLPLTEESKGAATEILDEGLGALLAERDPRKAVIGAYVAMERAMASKGWARHPHEAPTEYLAHVLGVAPSRAGDLDELVGLYEYARFSEHAVTGSMRDAAVDAVRRLRADLLEPV